MSDKLPAKLIKIGNSRGVRLPQRVIEEAKLGEELELLVEDERIIIQTKRHPRADWAREIEESEPFSEEELEEMRLWDAIPSPILDEEEDPDWLRSFGIDG